MKLAIVGGRTFDDYPKLCGIIGTHFYYLINCVAANDDEIISGGANGADGLAKKYAVCCGLRYIEFLAEWDKYGKSAGFLRNQTIVDNCDMVLAFWDGKSRGTADTIEKAKRAKKPTFIVFY